MTPGTIQTESSRFRVGTFNLLNYNAPPNACYESDNIYSNQQWQEKRTWTSSHLALMAADIVGFQEVFSPEDLNKLVLDQGFEHFVTVAKPTKDRHHIYSKPVVALASRYPILKATTIRLTKSMKQKSALPSLFRFSRAPLKAEVMIDGFGQCLVYVVHLKSNRTEVPQTANSKNWSTIAARSMSAQAQSYWNSIRQRGNEVTLLYQDVIKEVSKKDRPVILMGDFNTSIGSETLQQIAAAREVNALNSTPQTRLPKEAKRQIRRFALYDGFELQHEGTPDKRKSTHYFANKGSVLDYVLLSKDFDASYDHSLASVVNYEIYDRHLQNPQYSIDSQCSDHAPVMVELEIRK
ncbi:MAG: endonuclease/exonuclease/phosphatase family protein [bacterium]|nr:endonuclease/exonuclease/phosphatase family protein [Gammaproteobacteria bacterium]